MAHTPDTMTFEELFKALGDDDAVSRAYDAARAKKVTEIADYIREYLKPGVSAEIYAEEIMAGAEEIGRFHGDGIGGEVASRHPLSGHPLAFEI